LGFDLRPPFPPPPPPQVLADEIERKYVGETIVDIGLIMAFFDFEELAPGFIYPADGNARYDVSFRLVAFRPFVGEVLTGRVSGANPEGLKVSLTFFEDVVIPGHFLQQPSEYRREENLWVWKYENDDEDGGDEDDQNQFAFHIGEQIRFRVRSLSFTQVRSTLRGRQAMTTSTLLEPPSAVLGAKAKEEDVPLAPVRKRSSSVDLTRNDQEPPIMQVIGLVNEDGLGLLSWWT